MLNSLVVILRSCLLYASLRRKWLVCRNTEKSVIMKKFVINYTADKSREGGEE